MDFQMMLVGLCAWATIALRASFLPYALDLRVWVLFTCWFACLFALLMLLLLLSFDGRVQLYSSPRYVASLESFQTESVAVSFEAHVKLVANERTNVLQGS